MKRWEGWQLPPTCLQTVDHVVKKWQVPPSCFKAIIHNPLVFKPSLKCFLRSCKETTALTHVFSSCRPHAFKLPLTCCLYSYPLGQVFLVEGLEDVFAVDKSEYHHDFVQRSLHLLLRGLFVSGPENDKSGLSSSRLDSSQLHNMFSYHTWVKFTTYLKQT